MKKILLSIGDAKAEAAIMNELNKRQPHEYSQPRAATYRDAVLQVAQQEQPDIIVISEKLKGNGDLLKMIYELRTTVPNARIVYIGSQKQHGDQTQQKLIMYGVYDQLLSAKITLNDMVDLIIHPRTFADIVNNVNMNLGTTPVAKEKAPQESKIEEVSTGKNSKPTKSNTTSVDEIINIDGLFGGELQPQPKETKKVMQPGIYVPPTTVSHIDYIAERMGIERDSAPKQEEKGFEIDLEWDLDLESQQTKTEEPKQPIAEKDVQEEIVKNVESEVKHVALETEKEQKEHQKTETVKPESAKDVKQDDLHKDEQKIQEVKPLESKEKEVKKDGIIRSGIFEVDTPKPSFLVGNIKDNAPLPENEIKIPEVIEVISLASLDEEEVEEHSEQKMPEPVKPQEKVAEKPKEIEKAEKPGKTTDKKEKIEDKTEPVKTEALINKGSKKELPKVATQKEEKLEIVEPVKIAFDKENKKQALKNKAICFYQVNSYIDSHDALNFAYALVLKGYKVLYATDDYNKNFFKQNEEKRLCPIKESVAEIQNIDYVELKSDLLFDSASKVKEYDYVIFDMTSYMFDEIKCILTLAGIPVVAVSTQNKAELEDLQSYFDNASTGVILALTEYEDGLTSSKAILRKNIWKKVVRIRTNRVSNYNCITSGVPLLAKKSPKEVEAYKDLLNALEV